MTREQRSDLSLALAWAALIVIIPANFVVAYSPLTALIQMGVALLTFIASLIISPKEKKDPGFATKTPEKCPFEKGSLAWKDWHTRRGIDYMNLL